MTDPRQILAGTTYLVTRRCLERRFYLKPTPEIIQAFGYLLAVVAERHGIVLHACCVLSNHYHLVLTDVQATLPGFMRELNGTLARFLNTLHRRKETVFPAGSYSAVELADEGAVLEACAYALANPVAAGLVRHGREWPGLWSSPGEIGEGDRVFTRPRTFFDPDGGLPPSATLVFSLPRGFEAKAFRSALEERLDGLEREAAAKLKAKKRHFLGRRKILAQRPEDRATGEEKPRSRQNRVAAEDVLIWLLTAARRWRFRDAYQDALKTFRSGQRNVTFPPGTYLLRTQLGVVCAAAG